MWQVSFQGKQTKLPLRLVSTGRWNSVPAEQWIQRNVQLKLTYTLIQFFFLAAVNHVPRYVWREKLLEYMKQFRWGNRAPVSISEIQRPPILYFYVLFLLNTPPQLTANCSRRGEAVPIPVCFPSSARVSWYMLSIWSQWAITLLRILSQWGASSPKSFSSWFLYQKAKKAKH